MTPALLLCLVVAIADGDTLTVRCGEPGAYGQVKVRLAAIDAPEKRQPWGTRSRQHLAALCFQQQATIRSHGHDRYGRTIAEVDCRGQDAGTEQVRAGMAWYYVRYGKGFEHLAGVEAQARAAGRGLWADPQPVEPWGWRRRMRGSPAAGSGLGAAQ